MALRSAFTFAVSAGMVAFSGAPDLSVFLTKHAGFSASQLKRIDRGEVVAHSLSAEAAEVALAAGALVKVPVSFYLERFRSIESFKRSAEVIQIGQFSDPPAVADLRGLTIDADEIQYLRDCRPGACDLQLPDDAFARLAGRTDVDQAFREWLAEYSARYLREGNAALASYHNTRTLKPVATPLKKILARWPPLHDQWPAVGAALGDFAGRLPDGLQQFLYWSKEKPPGNVVINVTHVIIKPETDGVAVLATKQIYASHYMHASLGLSVLIDRSTAEGPRTLVVYMNRTHVDLFDGVMGKMIRPVVRSRARGGAERLIGRLRTRLEADWAARSGK